jgi:hypothetical protein
MAVIDWHPNLACAWTCAASPEVERGQNGTLVMGRQMASPTLLLSSRASSVMRLDRYDAALDEADFDGIDLDGTNELRRMFVSSRSMPKTLANRSVCSIWLRPLQLETSGLQPFRDIARTSGTERLPLVVVDVPAAVDADDALALQIAAAVRLRAVTGPETRIAMVRHQVGEWEFQIALDLTSRTDGTWEAEAAMMRILPRLAMIRLTVPRTLLSGGIRWRIASRVVAAAADGGYRGMLSIAPELSLWEKLSVNALADRSAMFAANLERRSVRLRGDRIRQPGRRTFR